MKIQFYKYQGTGNDFIMIDNRDNHFPKSNTQLINKLCDRRFGIGADGLILLENSNTADFKMIYFNADGNESTMCGNGGRCIVAFAKKLKIISDTTTFTAIDGIHHATINDNLVSLQMIDIDAVQNYDSHLFLNTGSPHYVAFTNDVSKVDVKTKGRSIRIGAPYFKEGTNVNFVEQIDNNTFKVRTYERGVEDETLSCGTGVVAVAIAANVAEKSSENEIYLKTLGGKLSVSFTKENGIYKEVFLTGKATFVFEGTYKI
ncbi:MAG: diaminopimelate epimerase [Flavobacteriaceae bacterium]|nr:diaminopimelate epimerase [Flavobacteriaceae bacterium]